MKGALLFFIVLSRNFTTDLMHSTGVQFVLLTVVYRQENQQSQCLGRKRSSTENIDADNLGHSFDYEMVFNKEVFIDFCLGYREMCVFLMWKRHSADLVLSFPVTVITYWTKDLAE